MRKITRLAICFGVLSLLTIGAQAQNFSVEDLNANRAQYGLPLITGNPSIDLPVFVRECNEGRQFSCTFIQQLQQLKQQQDQQPQGNNQSGQPSANDPDAWDKEMRRVERIGRMLRGDAAKQSARDHQTDLDRHQKDIQDRKIERMFR